MTDKLKRLYELKYEFGEGNLKEDVWFEIDKIIDEVIDRYCVKGDDCK